jgi:hypothetical protein
MGVGGGTERTPCCGVYCLHFSAATVGAAHTGCVCGCVCKLQRQVVHVALDSAQNVGGCVGIGTGARAQSSFFSSWPYRLLPCIQMEALHRRSQMMLPVLRLRLSGLGHDDGGPVGSMPSNDNINYNSFTYRSGLRQGPPKE